MKIFKACHENHKKAKKIKELETQMYYSSIKNNYKFSDNGSCAIQ